jgi:ATPase subunit of ABC transporter with duplicated ATPase domains
MLKVKDLTKYYGEERILNRVSFKIEQEHKVALVGFNGVGKSTLLKILAGIEEPDKGQVEYNKNVTVGFLPQDPNHYNNKKVIDYIKETYGGEDDELFRRNVEIMFAGFLLSSEIKDKKIGVLSSGQKTKVFLTALLIKKPNLLLLDEPTNNLDLPALIWLENYLKNFKTAFIVVSHDKKFLSNVANKVYEINWVTKNIEISNGTYTDYIERKGKELKRQKLDYTLQKEDIDRLNKLAKNKVESARKGAKYVGPDNDRILQGYRRSKAADSLKDAKVVYNRIKRMDKVDKPINRKSFVIDIDVEEIGNSRDIKITDLVCGYEDFEVGPVNLNIEFGQRVCLLGLNGSGKTTFLKTLTADLEKKTGEVLIGEGVKFGNLMQEHTNLPKNKNLIKFLMERTGVEKKVAEEYLDYFGFKSSQFNNEILILSPGARARLLLALFAIENVNTLILDEPTNHLDIEAGEALQKALDKFKGTIIFATHDREFVEQSRFSSLNAIEENNFIKIENFKDYINEMEKKSKKLIRLLK